MTNQLLNYICLTNLRLKHYFKFFRHPNKKALNLQLKRTLVKKDTQNVGIINLIDKLTQYKKFNKNQRVLFVGCRNDFELNYFKKLHQAKITGIDLYSESSQIKIMDMHQLEFENNTFDLVFASHVLEHAYNPQQAVNEWLRVAKHQAYFVIEVPVNYPTNEIDKIDFKTIPNLKKLFKKVKMKIIWSRQLKNGDNDNFHETDIISIIFQIDKK